SPYSASDSISNSPSMLVNEMIGNTTLMASAEMPRALVLASVTGVGALAAPDGAATPKATALPRTTAAPPARSTFLLGPDLPQHRIAISLVRRSIRRAPGPYRCPVTVLTRRPRVPPPGNPPRRAARRPAEGRPSAKA